MRLEAIVVCVNYSDFLEHTLPENMKYFDRVVVVTSPEDRATQALCNRLGVDFIETTVFYEYGEKRPQHLYLKSRFMHPSMEHYEEQRAFDDAAIRQGDGNPVEVAANDPFVRRSTKTPGWALPQTSTVPSSTSTVTPAVVGWVRTGTVGGSRSAGVPLAEALWPLALPAASTASTVYQYIVPSTRPESR